MSEQLKKAVKKIYRKWESVNAAARNEMFAEPETDDDKIIKGHIKNAYAEGLEYALAAIERETGIKSEMIL